MLGFFKALCFLPVLLKLFGFPVADEDQMLQRGKGCTSQKEKPRQQQAGRTHSLPIYFPSAMRLFILHLYYYKYYNCDAILETTVFSFAAQSRKQHVSQKASAKFLCAA